jgi:DNA polymerase-3 subunit alpha
MGITVLPPTVNKSFADFEPEGENAIRFGLAGLKGVGEAQVHEMVREREANGPFKNLWDFCQRVAGANKKVVESLILAGAFDEFGDPRQGLLSVLEGALKQAKNIRVKKEAGQDSLFDALGGSAEDEFGAMEVFEAPKVPQEEFEEMERFAKEREVAGLYVSGHPLDSAQAAWEQVRQVGLGQLTDEHIAPMREERDPNTNRKVRVPEKTWTVAGIITQRQTLYTKKTNAKFFKLILEDLTGSREIMMWPRTLEQNPDLERITEPGSMVWGRIHVEEDTRGFGAAKDDNVSDDAPVEGAAVEEAPQKQLSVSFTVVKPFHPDAVDTSGSFEVKLPKSRVTRQLLNDLKDTLAKFPGMKKVELVIVDDGQEVRRAALPGFPVAPSDELTAALRALIAATD